MRRPDLKTIQLDRAGAQSKEECILSYSTAAPGLILGFPKIFCRYRRVTLSQKYWIFLWQLLIFFQNNCRCGTQLIFLHQPSSVSAHLGVKVVTLFYASACQRCYLFERNLSRLRANTKPKANMKFERQFVQFRKPAVQKFMVVDQTKLVNAIQYKALFCLVRLFKVAGRDADHYTTTLS